jgi:Mn-containing catalase
MSKTKEEISNEPITDGYKRPNPDLTDREILIDVAQATFTCMEILAQLVNKLNKFQNGNNVQNK